MTEKQPVTEPQKFEPFSWDDFPDFFDDDQALTFLIDFTQLDFTQLKRGDWLKLTDDLRRFLGIHPQQAQTLQDYQITPDSLAALQAELAVMLKAFLQARDRYLADDQNIIDVPLLPAVDTPSPTQSVNLSPAAAVAVEWGPLGIRPRLKSPQLRDHLLFTMSLLLLRNDIDLIRECPTCSRLFYASHGRQKFCSAQCKNRAAWEDFVARQQQDQVSEKLSRKPGTARNQPAAKVKGRPETAKRKAKTQVAKEEV